MPVHFNQHCLLLTCLSYISCESYFRKYEKYSHLWMLIYYRINEFVKNVWPTKWTLFIYVSTYCVVTVK